MGGRNEAYGYPPGSGNVTGMDGEGDVRAKLLAGARWELRTLLGRHRAIALALLRARRGDGFLAPIRAETEIVIEGFPRSGNTFAVAAFHLAQRPADVPIAHHAHVPAQLLEAVRLGLPAVALVRQPEECVLSLVVRAPSLGLGGVLRGWVRFHEPLVRVRDRLVVVTFEDATSDVGGLVRTVNERFGTRFREFEHTPENLARVRALIEQGDLNTFGSTEGAERGGGLPASRREALKDRLRLAYGRPELGRLRRRAERLYAELADSSARAT
jgi:hypothetical protein